MNNPYHLLYNIMLCNNKIQSFSYSGGKILLGVGGGNITWDLAGKSFDMNDCHVRVKYPTFICNGWDEFAGTLVNNWFEG